MQSVDILAIGVHPDDVELGCAGTLLAHAARGYTFAILDLTRGELGSRGNAEIRSREAAAAARVLGAAWRANCALADGFFTQNGDSLRRIISYVRTARPTIVLANALEDRHPDHGRAAKLIADACYLSGLVRIETTNQDGQPQAKWRPRSVYHYSQDYNRPADLVVDISDHLERKMEAILCYKSQFHQNEQAEYATEPQTPISGPDFLNHQRHKAAVFGREAGVGLGEAFNVTRVIGVTDLLMLQ